MSDLKPQICGKNRINIPEAGCSDCEQLEARVKDLEDRADVVDGELPKKLEKDNIIAGDRITLDVDGNNITISADGDYYTKDEMDDIIDSLEGVKFELVNELPTVGEPATIYLVPSAPGSDDKLEYIWIENRWELIGHTSMDLSDYYTKAQTDTLLGGKVDKETGKGLSTNDYTTAEKTKLAGIEAGAEVNVQSDWNQTDSTKDDFIKNKPGKATQSADGLMSKEDKTKLDGITWTKEGILDLLGYVLLEVAIEDTDGEVTMRRVLAEEPETFRTVLYSNGLFIINESSYDKTANEEAYGAPTNIYPAYDPVSNPYTFSVDGDQPWYAEIDSILSLKFGSTVAPTSTFRWFSAMHNVVTIDLTGLDTSNTTTFERMFTQCNSLKNVNTEVLNTSNVTSMMMTFYRCDVVEAFDLSTWDTSKVTTMNQMFRQNSLLETIYVSATFSTVAVTNSNNMFTDCTSLVGGAGTTYDSTQVKADYARIDNPPSEPGYFTARP